MPVSQISGHSFARPRDLYSLRVDLGKGSPLESGATPFNRVILVGLRPSFGPFTLEIKFRIF